MITWLFGFFVGVGIGAIVTFGFAYWYLKDLFPIEAEPIEKPDTPTEEKVWSIFLDDPRIVGFNSILIAKYAEISETQAKEVLQGLFYKNKLTRMDGHGYGYIYYRNPAALLKFKCKKCGTENTPEHTRQFGRHREAESGKGKDKK